MAYFQARPVGDSVARVRELAGFETPIKLRKPQTSAAC
jgi:hypothetical protein